MTHGTAGLLLLSDGRLPSGAYAHSGGLEAAIRSGRVRDIADLEAFLVGRATTTGAMNAAFAAAACARVADVGTDPLQGHQDLSCQLDELDRELDARTPSPALRRVSHTLGRQMLRALQMVSPHPLLQQVPTRPNQPVAFGAGSAVLDLSPLDAARGVLHETVSGPASAVVKLMSADPFDAYRTIAGMRTLLNELADYAAQLAREAPEDLPAYGAPLSDYLAEVHETEEVRLFAS